MSKVFGDFDISDFWEQSEFARKEYIDAPLTDRIIADVQRALGYTLPRAYIELMRQQNGGVPTNKYHRTKPNSWTGDHISIHGIFAIGRVKSHSLCGEFGSRFWIDEWQYPPIGIYFADCPSAGHDMVCLDYRDCGHTGEPQVVHVDQEGDCRITFLAKDFETFIRGLNDCS